MRPLLQSTLVYWYHPWCPGLKFHTHRLKAIFSFSFNTLGSNFLWVAFAQIDVFLLGRMASESLLGIYSMAKDLALLPVSKVGVVVNQISRPMLALFQNDVPKMQSSFLHGLRLVNMIILPICLGLAMVGEEVVKIGLGDKWLPCIPILQVLCFYGIVRSFNLFLPHVLLAKYKASFLFRYSLFRLIFMFGGLWGGTTCLTNFFDVNSGLAMGISWMCFYPLVSVVIVRKTLLELNLSWLELFRELIPAVRATLSMAVVGIVFEIGFDNIVQWKDAEILSPLIRAIVEIFICALVYVGVLVFGSSKGTSDLIRILQLVGGEKVSELFGSYLTKFHNYVITR